MKFLTGIGLLLVATSYTSLSFGAYPRLSANDSPEVRAAKMDAAIVFNAYQEYPGNNGDVDCEMDLKSSSEVYRGQLYRVCIQKASPNCAIISLVLHRDTSGLEVPDLRFIGAAGSGCPKK